MGIRDDAEEITRRAGMLDWVSVVCQLSTGFPCFLRRLFAPTFLELSLPSILGK